MYDFLSLISILNCYTLTENKIWQEYFKRYNRFRQLIRNREYLPKYFIITMFN